MLYMTNERYESARKIYQSIGVDTEAALDRLKNVPVSMHCWQGDDVIGFDSRESLSGGIQTTGNYPGRAATPEQLMQDISKVLTLVPGKKKLNLHASYAIIDDGSDRDSIKPKHFTRWVEFAKKYNMGIDFNPTFFSHRMVKDGLTLSSPDEEVRKFWIEHGKRCIEISEYFANETGQPCVMNIWIPDGYKDIPADRLGPRRRFKESLDEMYVNMQEEEGKDKYKRRILLYSLSESYYRYLVALEKIYGGSVSGSLSDIGLAEPVKVYSNVCGGVGILGACQRAEKVVDIRNLIESTD